MGVIGFEIDQVIRVSGDGDEDISVPISAAYNHHYSGTLNNGRECAICRNVVPPLCLCLLSSCDSFCFWFLSDSRGGLSGLIDRSTLEKLRSGDPRIAKLEARTGHGAGFEPYLPVEHTPSVSGQPTSLVLGGGNGGEYRKTFHGYAPGFVQTIESPTEIQITPMQIDTWHREAMNITGGTPPKFVSTQSKNHNMVPWSAPSTTALLLVIPGPIF